MSAVRERAIDAAIEQLGWDWEPEPGIPSPREEAAGVVDAILGVAADDVLGTVSGLAELLVRAGDLLEEVTWGISDEMTLTQIDNQNEVYGFIESLPADIRERLASRARSAR